LIVDHDRGALALAFVGTAPVAIIRCLAARGLGTIRCATQCIDGGLGERADSGAALAGLFPLPATAGGATVLTVGRPTERGHVPGMNV
jgi:hypothetical protein